MSELEKLFKMIDGVDIFDELEFIESVGNTDVVIGVLPDELKKIYTLYVQTVQNYHDFATAPEIDISKGSYFGDDPKVKYDFGEMIHLIKVLEELFYYLLFKEYGYALEGYDGVMIRKGWVAVYFKNCSVGSNFIRFYSEN